MQPTSCNRPGDYGGTLERLPAREKTKEDAHRSRFGHPAERGGEDRANCRGGLPSDRRLSPLAWFKFGLTRGSAAVS